MGDEANLSKQAAADRAERYVREQLDPKNNAVTRTLLGQKLEEFEKKFKSQENPNASEADKEKALEQARTMFTEEMVRKAREGAIAGGDYKDYKYSDPAEKRQKETSTGLIRGIINNIAGGIGGIFGILWDLFKHLPIVGDMIASIGDKRSDEKKAHDKAAAGVANKLNTFSVRVNEHTSIPVAFNEQELGTIYQDLSQPRPQVAAQPATTTVPAATPESNPASPEVLQSARDAATPARTAGANDPRDVGLNGGLPPAPLVAVAVANNATGPVVG
jgi:hypothetical protein